MQACALATLSSLLIAGADAQVSGNVSTLAGGGGAANSGGSDGTGTAAYFNVPTGVCVDAASTFAIIVSLRS